VRIRPAAGPIALAFGARRACACSGWCSSRSPWSGVLLLFLTLLTDLSAMSTFLSGYRFEP
jgi:hypothetical protein